MPARSSATQRHHAALLSALRSQLAALGEDSAAEQPHSAETGNDPSAALSACASAVVRAHEAGQQPVREALRAVVRSSLAELAQRAPGRSVEVRVPPFSAVQVIAGPHHTRGTPPNTVQTDPLTWVRLATGRLSWEQARAEGSVEASGNRADLAPWLPLWPSR
ncbi:hypothetical protein FHX37_4257 [Haloactinospora alba]|uniref:Bacterial SCP orthologue domain-containing protein n=1 Tax=Haloactinospora alba TaxID=405555 RepID=A0A543N6T2_9ACTN|nr:sterol carrier family protein [Haloactinospora alba]TQN27536.1 hypothetical protein FHX37_4257 [Haloactinospora alba]